MGELGSMQNNAIVADFAIIFQYTIVYLKSNKSYNM